MVVRHDREARAERVDLEDAAQAYPDAIWPGQAADTLRALIHAANTRQKTGRLLLECLDKREADVLLFLTDLRIPPTSNQAERDLRPAKTPQRISGRLRSETAARRRYAIRGYISTAAKHGENMITVIRDALAGTLAVGHLRMSTPVPVGNHATL